MITRTWKRSVLEALNGSYSQCSSFGEGLRLLAHLQVWVLLNDAWCWERHPRGLKVQPVCLIDTTGSRRTRRVKPTKIEMLRDFWDALSSAYKSAAWKYQSKGITHPKTNLLSLFAHFLCCFKPVWLCFFYRTQKQKLPNMFLLLFFLHHIVNTNF